MPAPPLPRRRPSLRLLCVAEPPDLQAGPLGGPTALPAASHPVRITYGEHSGALRRATVQITPNGGVRPSWRGDVDEVAISGPTGWILIRNLREGDGALTGTARLPAPDQIRAFALRTSGGERFHWRSPSARNGDEEEPEGPADPPKDDDDEERHCSTAGCNGIIDPWTCECNPDLKDPWEDERVTEGAFSSGI